MTEFRDKVVLSTGGCCCCCIGAGLAEAFARRARASPWPAPARLEAVRRRLKARPAEVIERVLDVALPEHWDAAIAEIERRLGPIDVLWQRPRDRLAAAVRGDAGRVRALGDGDQPMRM